MKLFMNKNEKYEEPEVHMFFHKQTKEVESFFFHIKCIIIPQQPDPIQEQDRQHPKNLLFLTDERVLRYGLTSEQDYGNTYDITDLRQAYPANDLWYHKNRVIREKELFVLVFPHSSAFLFYSGPQWIG